MNDLRSEKFRRVGEEENSERQAAVKKEESSCDSSASIFNWYNTNEWRVLMLRSKPATEVFEQLVDFEQADLYALKMISSPWNVPLKKSKHAGEGLPRPYMFNVVPNACSDRWWSTLFEEGILKESPSIIKDRRFVVKSHMIGIFTFVNSFFGRLRIDDFYYPTFWLEVNINMQEKKVIGINGRHAEATSFHIKRNPFPNVVFDPIGTIKRPRYRSHISANNILSVWDVEEEHVAFEVVCELTNFFKIANKK